MRLGAWLLPGLGIKRWLLVFCAGVLLLGLGLGLALHTDVLAWSDLWISRTAFLATGTLLPAWAVGVLGIIAGLLLVVFGARNAVRAIVSDVAPAEAGRLAGRMAERHSLLHGPRVVVLGGGTGLATLLHGIKRYTHNVTAIVTVTDDGGSSGRLRGELGILPPGDVRNVLVALADTEPLMERLFQYRFDRGELKGHTLGNLFIGALTELTGGFEEAVRASSRVLAVRGEVLPSTVDDVRLVARFKGGQEVTGETRIVEAGRHWGRIQSLRLDPADCRPVPAALEAILAADAVIIGPGSLYTSIAPNLLVPAVAAAIQRSHARKIFIVNVMTQPGETDGFSVQDHVAAVEGWLGTGVLDAVVVNSGAVDEGRLKAYREEQSERVRFGDEPLGRRGVRVIGGNLVAARGLVRHDSDALARAVMNEILRTALGDTSRLVERLVLAQRLAHARRVQARGGSR